MLTLTEQISALANTDDHLAFAVAVIARSELSAAEREELLQRCANVKQRLDDPCLYLAVVGEFSSGKSSFINAFLQEPLLPTSALVTTAAPTWIRGGDELTIDLRAAGRVETEALVGLGPDLPTDPHRLLDAARASTDVGDLLARIDVGLPSPLLADGLVVIDTPGFNATDDGHSDLSQYVLQYQADLAVVVLPADAAVSQALADYLAGNLTEAVLSRLLFVVTKLANVDDAQHEKLLSTIRRRLQTMLGIADPWVVGCSLRAVNRSIAGDKVEEEERRWVEAFDGVREALRTELVRTRVLAVSDRTLDLVDEAMGLLGANLASQVAELERAKSQLDAAKIQDLQSFLNEHEVAALDELSRSAKDCRSLVEVAPDTALGELRSEIAERLDACTSTAMIQSYVQGEFVETVSDVSEALAAYAKGVEDELILICEEAVSNIGAAFEQQYKTLTAMTGGALSLDSSSGADVVGGTGLSVDVGEANSSIAAALRIESNYETGGAIAAAAIGTAILPVVGTVVGWFAGKFLGSLFAPPLPDVRLRALQELDASLVGFMDLQRMQLLSRFDRTHDGSRRYLVTRSREYRRQYDGTVARLVADHERKVAVLQAKQAQLDVDVGEIRRRREHIIRNRKAILMRSNDGSEMT